MTSSGFDGELTSPFVLPSGSAWYHWPAPRQRLPSGTHPSKAWGIGDEIAVIREIAPGDDFSYYSLPHSAIAKRPVEVRFLKTLETRVVFVLDLAPAMAFGTPEKRDTLIHIFISLAFSALSQPADAMVSVIAPGAFTARKDDIGSEMELRAFTQTLLSVPLRQERGVGLAEAVEAASQIPESLVCVLSDFLIPEDSAEWRAIASACDQCAAENSEVIFFRILDAMEADFRGSGSLTVSSDQGAVWTSGGTRNAVRRRNRAIRAAIARIVDEPELRFCEVVSGNPRLPDVIADFLNERVCHLRRHMPNLPFA